MIAKKEIKYGCMDLPIYNANHTFQVQLNAARIISIHTKNKIKEEVYQFKFSVPVQI